MAEPKRQSKAKPKIPPYFRSCSPPEWDIHDYLDAEFVRKGATQFDFGAAINNWSSTILHLSNRGEGDQVTWAKTKIADFKGRPGHLSDKARARNWRDKKNRNIPAAPPPRPPVLPSRSGQQFIYHGPVNQVIGTSIENSTINFGGATGVPAGSADASYKETVDVEKESVEVDAEVTAAVPEPDMDGVDAEQQRFSLLCKSFRELRKTMTTTLPLPSGGNLEACLEEYVNGLSQMDPAHGFIVDKNMLSSLSVEDREQVLSQLEPLPAFPDELEHILVKYKKVASLAQCRKVSRKLTKSYPDEDIYWIARVFEQMARLIHHGHMSLDLGEGVLDTLVNAILWDNYFLDIPDMLLQRKEITLSAMEDEPYKYLSYDPRYDGVLRTREHGKTHSYELALFEVSRKYEYESKKANKDRAKLLAGCRAMLYRLRELVNNDEEIIKKLHVVGVLQAGLHTQLFVMTCLNVNLFHLRAGKGRELPKTYACIGEVSDVITLAWKAKRIILDTAAVVRNYLQDAEAKESCIDRTDPEWF